MYSLFALPALKPGERFSLMTYEPSTKAARIHAILFLKPLMEAYIYPLCSWRHSVSIKVGIVAYACKLPLEYSRRVPRDRASGRARQQGAALTSSPSGTTSSTG